VTIGPRGDPANSEGIAWQPAHPKPPTMAALESQQLHDLSSPAEPCDFGQAAKAGDATQSTASKRAKQLNRRFTEPACKSVRLPLPQDEEEQQDVPYPIIWLPEGDVQSTGSDNANVSLPRRFAIVSGMARIRLTLTLQSGARIGPGKAQLLESVHATGSISAAARALGIDYKRAWLLLDSINRAFVTPAVERTAGGSGGGGAVLTPFGKKLLARYRRLEAATGKMAAADLKALEKQAAGDPGPKV